ncbi:hypothetical protein CYMTET_27132 [Cymbomonas tetramitiformis]|uniref:Uncharacterized protein n=1 Tax=Cymbomonas tetramitiformis TaxID=36881 RepID=A0AAE0FQD3_9CHLO|nr:hypothetical protein CYMTET_30247 [Cymbomonas tetramitiformis]KAK3264104.1 hypothetical protein CYMTET_27132 [Cymbomonas tetramitiformis]
MASYVVLETPYVVATWPMKLLTSNEDLTAKTENLQKALDSLSSLVFQANSWVMNIVLEEGIIFFAKMLVCMGIIHIAISLDRTYSQQLPSKPPAVVHPPQQPQLSANLAAAHVPRLFPVKNIFGRARRAQQQQLQRVVSTPPEPMEHIAHLEQELLQSEAAVINDAVQQQLVLLAATQQPSLLDPCAHPTPSTVLPGHARQPHLTTPSTAEEDYVDLDAPTISRAVYETRRTRRRTWRLSWSGAPPSPPMSDEDKLSETDLLVFTAQADGTTAVASVEREAELPPAEGERSTPSSAFSFGNSQKTRGGNFPVYEVFDHREVSLISGFTTSVFAQGASTSTAEASPATKECPDDVTYVPASFKCDEDEYPPKDDSDAESAHGWDAEACRREGKEPATDTPGQLRVLLASCIDGRLGQRQHPSLHDLQGRWTHEARSTHQHRSPSRPRIHPSH